MSFNFRLTYKHSDEYTRIAIIALFVILGGVLVASIFLSPQIVFGMIIGISILLLSFLKPDLVLLLLLFYLPFEPFVLKWLSDDIFIYAKYGSEVLIYFLVMSVLWMRFSGKIKLKNSPIDLIFILLLFIAIASSIINWVPATYAVLGIRQIIRFILLFFVTLQLNLSKKWIRNLIFGLFIILAVQVVIGYGQFFFVGTFDSFLLPSQIRTIGNIEISAGVIEFWDPGQRIFGTMGRYDQLGMFMAFLMLILVSLLYEPRLIKYRSYFSLLLLASIPALAMTYSRSSWFGFILGFLFISVVMKRDKRVMLVTAFLLVVILLYLIFSGLVVGNLIESTQQGLIERFFEAFSYRRWMSEYYGLGRLYWIVHTITTVVPSAFVFGHGPATYGGGAVSALGYSAVYDQLGLPFGVYGKTGFIDNNWFSIWGELGTLGLSLYLWMYGTLFAFCIKVWKKTEKIFTRALSLGVAAAMISVAINAFLATSLEIRTLAPYLWVMTAIVVLLAQKEKIIVSNEDYTRK